MDKDLRYLWRMCSSVSASGVSSSRQGGFTGVSKDGTATLAGRTDGVRVAAEFWIAGRDKETYQRWPKRNPQELMDIRLIEGFDAFLKLSQPWNELAAQTPDDHAYMRHEWFKHWLSSRDETAQLYMITGWQDGQLVGVLPLVWKQLTLRGMRFRSLGFAESAVSPRCNALILEPDVLGPLVGRLAAERKCQLLELEQLEADSPTTRKLLDTLCQQTSLLVHVSPGRQSPYLALHCSWEGYLQGLTSRRRSWIKNSCIKRLADCGHEHEIRFVTDESEAGYLVDVMLDVSNRSWKAKAGTAIGQVPSQRRLYSEFTKVGLAHGLVEAVVLTLDGQPAAFDYYLKKDRRYSGIRSDYDRLVATCSPGQNLRIALIRKLTQTSGLAEIDFGGIVADHKLQWANHIRNHLVIHCASPFSKGAGVILWKKVKASLQRQSISDSVSDPITEEPGDASREARTGRSQEFGGGTE